MERKLTKERAIKALTRLDQLMSIDQMPDMSMAIGGVGAMILSFGFTGSTSGIDITLMNLSADIEDLKKYVPVVAKEFGLSADWLNPYFQSFTFYLPVDTKSRFEKVFSGETLAGYSLGAEDIVIMKLMAGRAKDISHVKFLLKKENLDSDLINKRLEELTFIQPEVAERALNLLTELLEKG